MTIAKINPSMVLVKLAPVMSLSSLILMPQEAELRDEGETAVALTRQSSHPVHGRVVMAGERVRAVSVGDVVLFHPEVGVPCDGLFPTPHLMLKESQIDAVIPPREGTV